MLSKLFKYIISIWYRVIERITTWLKMGNNLNTGKGRLLFPLLPLSKGFSDTAGRLLKRLEKLHKNMEVQELEKEWITAELKAAKKH